ncbi:MAG: [FeFe] hydrogenase H-cluster radical SAM maturase HydE [Bacteroidia bacterium]|nr:[FeFe] hydrogenase H-cluster radical SAM maturase HydE [Bacteroidia bacterium]
MNDLFSNLLDKEHFEKDDLICFLNSKEQERKLLFEKSAKIKQQYIGNKVYFRGLIEYSNICHKNCLYCGIRAGNKNLTHYTLSDEEVIRAAKFAYENNYGSVVLQSGEIESSEFTEKIDKLIWEIKKLSDNKLGLTLSLGEQSEETYKQWFKSGAHRYLLRIETSNQTLYSRIHPNNSKHSFEKRLVALNTLKKLGFQAGTGVMIGLPFQTTENLADDLIFMKEFDIDMCGMGPYIEHKDTPLYEFRNELLPLNERFDLSLKMIAILRILMKDINIASTTALQAIDPIGREKAIKIGANIIMPNITPGNNRDNYLLYENKPCTDEEMEDCKSCLEARLHFAGAEIGYGEWGDSMHFKNKNI